jgi:hypothetical protein
MTTGGSAVPTSVRYVKNGAGGRWWSAAKARGEIHAGWNASVPRDLLKDANMNAIKPILEKWWSGKSGATQDINALRTLLDHPSQDVWITFEERRLWWCTVHDGVSVSSDGETNEHGNFWLTCARPWSDRSIDGTRHLAIAELPGFVTAIAGFRSTVCEPKASKEILRIIRNEADADAEMAVEARSAYEEAILRLVSRLGWKDFEVLVDLILSRTGWARVAVLGSVGEDVDIEAENASTEEIAFVQVKSQASQAVLDDYVSRFSGQRDHYDRMIFAVHDCEGALTIPKGLPVHVWTGRRIAQLVVKHGLGDWIAKRV